VVAWYLAFHVIPIARVESELAIGVLEPGACDRGRVGVGAGSSDHRRCSRGREAPGRRASDSIITQAIADGDIGDHRVMIATMARLVDDLTRVEKRGPLDPATSDRARDIRRNMTKENLATE
jgi:hypothetical protein